MEVADVAPIHKVPDHASAFLNTSSSNTTNYRLIISQFKKKAGVCTVLEICCVRCEEEWGEDSSLRGSSAIQEPAGDTVPQLYILLYL